MHSMSLPSGGTAHFHGDFSGNVVFEMEGDEFQRHVHRMTNTGEVHIPFEDIEKVVLEKYRRRVISELEQMDTEELGNLFGRAW